ncbi:SpoIIE family protein phosphatase [Clostridium lacusfryxellense]|uniref:SpoIIE family protein phosphatase n=1 Tax=Clostridium lacusfryxellense TaxID=205328 RepID=UPI001C0D300F|nr:SpoIIE family protein phosphatase [Clostridium lacusfryxellense]MBU3113421.1 serine/threonine-protein phosphatase [Clostridium lacusfryxellense]
MDLFIDVAYNSLIKKDEELCGDRVEIIRLADSTIIVMADGLGSGVKANILASLTAKIASTMLKEGADIYETVDTIVNTLPVCKVRNIAYCTFTLMKIYNDGRAYIAEYDNPPFFLIRNDRKIEKKESIINGKKVLESEFKLHEGDVLTVVSDGCIHAGIGNILNLGWSWNNVENYLNRNTKLRRSSKNITRDLIQVCWDLYGGRPGDDTTVVCVKARRSEIIDLFTGPPNDERNDSNVIKEFMIGTGKKIICGGTTSNIASRELGRTLNVNLDFFDKDVPPTATMDGIDLITEGVLTLSKAVEKLRNYEDSFAHEDNSIDLEGKDGASRLVKMLIEDCTHFNLWVGRAINPAHQNPDFPIDLSAKLKIVDQLVEYMKKLGKCVIVNYI